MPEKGVTFRYPAVFKKMPTFASGSRELPSVMRVGIIGERGGKKMTITKKSGVNEIIFSLEGRLDSITSLEFQDTLISAFNECEHVSLDIKDVSFISSAGLRVLLMAQKTARGRKGSFTLLNVSEQIMKLLDMTGLSAHLNISP